MYFPSITLDATKSPCIKRLIASLISSKKAEQSPNLFRIVYVSLISGIYKSNDSYSMSTF